MIPSKMTDEIAFELGQFKFTHCFYSYVEWKMNLEPFPLYYFFTWSVGGALGGYRLKKTEKDTYVVDWTNWVVSGKLKKDMFTDLSHKYAFVRGVLKEHYSKRITPTSIWLCWANSYDLRDMFVSFASDVLLDKFGFAGGSWSITQTEGIGTIPGTPELIVTATEDIIKYLIGNESEQHVSKTIQDTE